MLSCEDGRCEKPKVEVFNKGCIWILRVRHKNTHNFIINPCGFYYFLRMHQKIHFIQQQLVFPETGQFINMLLMCHSPIYSNTGLAAWLYTWLDKVKLFFFLLGWTDLLNIQQCWIILQRRLLKDRVLNQIDSHDWRKLDVKLLVGGPGAWTARKMISLDAAVSMS